MTSYTPGMLGLLCSILLVAPVQATQASNPLFTPDQMKSDLRLAHQIFDTDDAGMYRYVSRPELNEVWHKAEAKLDRPMDALEFFRILLPTVAAQKCGHSGAQLPKTMQDELTSKLPLLPLFVKVLPDGAYVYRDLSGTQDVADGSKIKSINGKPIKQILSTLMRSVTMDGDSTSGRRQKTSGLQFSAYLYTLIGIKAPYKVEVTMPSGKIVTRSFDGVVVPEFTKRAIEKKAILGDDADPAKFSFLDDGRIGYLKVVQFNDSDGHEPVRRVYEDTFKALKDKNTKSLIIDVRYNGGGEDELGQILLSYLETKPFQYYDHLYLNNIYFKSSSTTGKYPQIPDGALTRLPNGGYELTGHPNWGVKQPTEPRFPGKVYILTNGYSFSTTCEFLSHIKSEHLATLIGEDTGGNYYGNTSGISNTVTLPSTQLRIRVPSVAYWIHVEHRYPPTSPITADLHVVPTIADWVAGRDPVMDRALTMARGK